MYFIIIIVIVIIITLYFKFKENNEDDAHTIDSMTSNNKELIYNPVSKPDYGIVTNEIPLNIFQTWHSKTLPPKMKENVRLLKKTNPEFKYYLFDDDDCREFIKTYYNESVIKAFDKLKPGAFKADLWRCCILYVFGGIYLDIKFNCANGFKLIELTNDEYFVMDYGDELAVYNAVIVCKPRNYIMLSCIKQIVENVENNYYGSSPLEVTGPKLMVKFLSPKEKRSLKRLSLTPTQTTLNIYKDNTLIIKSYPEYKTERQMTQLYEHYSVLWNNHDIYN